MDLTGKKSKTKVRAAALEKRFAEKFSNFTVGSRSCFGLPDGRVIAWDTLGAYDALVIEYADNYEEARINRFEDGDLFYLDEMNEETMFQAMLREIEQ